MLTDVPVISQRDLQDLFRFGICSGSNILILGPSGGGKTLIAMQVVEEMECRLVYVNLSVLERTDFQGLPVITEDKTLVDYATPSFLPFSDTKIRDEVNTLNALLEWAQDNKKTDIVEKTRERLTEIHKNNIVRKLKQNVHYVNKLLGDNSKITKALSSLEEEVSNDKPIVFLFDEVDKASHEVLQTLLEFLQFRSVNGRPMNIKACILTGNLPDEFANSAQISHAITKRCLTFKLQLEFNQWREWAFNNNVHPQIIGFLTAHPEYLHKGPPDNDPTAYALPAPRTWSNASEGLHLLDSDSKFSKMRQSDLETLRIKVLAGNVGDSAAIAFNNWLKFYHKMDPVVFELLENGTFPDVKKLDVQEVFICALSACSKVYMNLKPNVDPATIVKHTKHVYKWLGTLSPDIQIGAARMAFGGDWENIRKYKLADIPEFTEVFKNLKKTISDTEWK